MNRMSSDRRRRRRLVEAASGFGSRVPVVLYACIQDAPGPEPPMAALRTQAEARDWIVCGAFIDHTDITSPRASRTSWPQVENLLESGTAAGLLARHEDEIALAPAAKAALRAWLRDLQAFAVYLPGLSRSPGGAGAEGVVG